MHRPHGDIEGEPAAVKFHGVGGPQDGVGLPYGKSVAAEIHSVGGPLCDVGGHIAVLDEAAQGTRQHDSTKYPCILNDL